MSNTYSQIYIHLVFSTKYRAPSLKQDFEHQLQSYIRDHAEDQELKILAIGGTQTHLHILLTMPPKFPVSKAAQIIKGSSSRWLNKYHFDKEKFRWQKGYGAFSINKSLLPTTINYIKRQKEHHSEITYKDEFAAFLDKHEIDYDNRKLFPSPPEDEAPG
ncbi:IS200/IS605 family transposase [Fodinibius saliphilus]|uniref:IS200/IS605 family transposase n=1 Tax=Fodinibius saliphilus TaxID=1920650 RepID=UPI0011096C76|nr:IS200/IS605 family transposase [Fodinibius saliphilus]